MKITIETDRPTRTYLCEDWSFIGDFVMLHTKPMVLFVNNKETAVHEPGKTVYINKKNIDYMEVETE